MCNSLIMKIIFWLLVCLFMWANSIYGCTWWRWGSYKIQGSTLYYYTYNSCNWEEESKMKVVWADVNTVEYFSESLYRDFSNKDESYLKLAYIAVDRNNLYCAGNKIDDFDVATLEIIWKSKSLYKDKYNLYHLCDLIPWVSPNSIEYIEWIDIHNNEKYMWLTLNEKSELANNLKNQWVDANQQDVLLYNWVEVDINWIKEQLSNNSNISQRTTYSKNHYKVISNNEMLALLFVLFILLSIYFINAFYKSPKK